MDKYKKYIENTTWIVPYANVLAYKHIDDNNEMAKDQTVWKINKYDNGYFFGDAYASIDGIKGYYNLIGTLTPLKDVLITFTSENSSPITGFGKFRRNKKGEYAFIMQMYTPITNTIGTSHWSFMISVNKNDKCYQKLPYLKISVDEFISEFD